MAATGAGKTHMEICKSTVLVEEVREERRRRRLTKEG
jgi:hypothetical protein